MDTVTSSPTKPVVINKRTGRVMTPQELANLKPYKPGTNGHGRVYPLKLRLQHALDHPLTEPKKDAPAGELLVYATLKGAIDLVTTPFKETWDRVEGRVIDTHAIVGKVIFEVVHVEKHKDYTGEFLDDSGDNPES